MPCKKHEFKREDHVYVNSKFAELIKDAVRFFHGTPVLSLPLEESFKGAGVYAIYCISKKGLYKTYGEKINRLSYDVPIYVGKAVPSGRLFSSLSLNERSCDFYSGAGRVGSGAGAVAVLPQAAWGESERGVLRHPQVLPGREGRREGQGEDERDER